MNSGLIGDFLFVFVRFETDKLIFDPKNALDSIFAVIRWNNFNISCKLYLID